MQNNGTKLTKYKPLKVAFMVDGQKLRHLENLLGTELEYTVSFSDGSDETFASIEEVLDLQNSKGRRIIGILANTLPNSEPEVVVALTSDAAQPFSPVEYHVSGPAKDVYMTYHKLEEYTSTLGQWYSRLTVSFRFYPAIWVLVFVLFFTALVLIFALALQDYAQSLNLGDWAYRSLVATSYFVLIGLAYVAATFVYWAAAKFINWLFPMGIFEIGEGLDRHNRLKATRKGVVGAVTGSGIIAAVVGALVGRLLGG